MRAPLFLLIALLIINAAVDWYILWQINHRCRRAAFWRHIHLPSSIIFACILVAVILIPTRGGGNGTLLTKMWLLFGYLTVYVSKMTGVIFDLIASVPRLFNRRRIKAITIAGIVIACALFAAMWWGALVNRFNIDNREVTVEIAGLPAEFDGYRIVQFSDLHTGTYGNDTAYVGRLVDNINASRPDLIVFTGDMVNRESAEMEPFEHALSRLHAPDGVLAILGNHDYGDYKNWLSPRHKSANMESLYNSYRRTGIELIRDSTVYLSRGGDSIAVIGVENIGDPPFPTYGSLRQAYPDLSDQRVKILLSHNPAHWCDSIRGNDAVAVDLTLSGHTHAMQIEVAGISPSALIYETWGGLYADKNEHHQLYVNIGEGCVGFPMRLGATPEVTVIILRRRANP